MRDVLKIYMQPAFLICAAVLATAGICMPIVVKSLGVHLKKEPVLLRKSLDLLDENNLLPYKVTSKAKIENEDIIKSLGTEDYVQWTLEDSSVSSDDNVRYCLLFITYYRMADQVPHTPEVCYTGGGYQQLTSEYLKLKITTAGVSREIPARYLVFSGSNRGDWQGSLKFPILYFFNVNGAYVKSRDWARLRKNIFSRYSYFCKIEWKFFNIKLGSMVYPTREEAVAASEKLLNVVLPVLEKEHWPLI